MIIIILKCFKNHVNIFLKKKKISEYNTKDIQFSSDFSDREDSVEENSDEENYNVENKYRMCLFKTF